MSGLEDVSKNKKSCFFPQLLDIIVPNGSDPSNLNEVFLVLEKEESDLRQFMKCGANLSFGQQHVKTVLYNLLCAAKFLSSANVIHRDLKPANILINRFCQVKLCDFGLARSLPESLAHRKPDATKKQKKTRCLSSHVSSRWFRSPEIILIEKEYDQGVDIWSIGCILYELITFSMLSQKPELAPKKVSALFPGDFCYPLTPKGNKKTGDDAKD